MASPKSGVTLFRQIVTLIGNPCRVLVIFMGLSGKTVGPVIFTGCSWLISKPALFSKSPIATKFVGSTWVTCSTQPGLQKSVELFLLTLMTFVVRCGCGPRSTSHKIQIQHNYHSLMFYIEVLGKVIRIRHLTFPEALQHLRLVEVRHQLVVILQSFH